MADRGLRGRANCKPDELTMTMNLLEFARGPGWAIAATIFVLGVGWRLLSLWRLPRFPDRSPAREGAPSKAAAAWGGIVGGMWPRKELVRRTRMPTINGYVFHVGLALVVFGFAPHIAFVHRILGVSWPALPDVVMVVASGVTILSLLMALMFRLTDPVLKQISRPDDWISWTLTFLPMFTGMAVITDPSATLLARDHVIYGGPLAVHLLSLELLLIWFPFGKLMHAFLFALSRGATGIRFSHRGVKV
jgi:nitrate reductase gamma subunit